MLDLFNLPPIEIINKTKVFKIKSIDEVTETETETKKHRNQIKYSDEMFMDLASVIAKHIKTRYHISYTKEIITRLNRALWSAHLIDSLIDLEPPINYVAQGALHFKYSNGIQVRMYLRPNKSDKIRVVIFDDTEIDTVYYGKPITDEDPLAYSKKIFDNEYSNPRQY